MHRKTRYLDSVLPFVFLLAALNANAAASPPAGFVNSLMPQPAELHVGTGEFVIREQLAVGITGFDNAIIDAAVQRAMKQLRSRTGIPLTATVTKDTAAQLTLQVDGPGEPIQSVAENESYRLLVTPDKVHLSAPTWVGALHGLQTLLQLVQTSGDGYSFPAVDIEDAPRFPWRGLMVDCGRHFEPVDELKRTIDGMAAVKLNVFHWHLTEDQGFRIESKIYPRLTEVGSDGLFYTQQQAREIVAYARERGIRVVPEFEMPGHSTAWLVAYPELASARSPSAIRREFGVSDLALDPTREVTYTFLERFLGEMVSIFPDAYLHIGGDETQAPEWKTDPRFQSFMREHELKDADALQAYFNGRVLAILTGLHKHMVGWDEILNPALPRDVVVQSWRGQASLVKGARAGYQGVLSAGYYLDGMQPAGVHYLVDPSPADAPLTAPQRKLILGGEICMFGEHVDERSIDSRIWPRSAAIAERLWSPATVTDVADMYRRLREVSIELELLGLHHLLQEDSGLRELAETEGIDDLRTFATSLEPVSFHDRYLEQKTSQLTVLDRFVDAIRPDPPMRFELEQRTRAFLKSPHTDSEDRVAITMLFEGWKHSSPAVQAQIARSPLLSDVALRAQQLPLLADAGLAAIQMLAAGTTAPAGWKDKQLALLEEARKPSGIVRFYFLDDLTQIISAIPQ